MTYTGKSGRLKAAHDRGATIYERGTTNVMRWLPRADQPGGTDPYPWVNAWGDRFNGEMLEARS